MFSASDLHGVSYISWRFNLERFQTANPLPLTACLAFAFCWLPVFKNFYLVFVLTCVTAPYTSKMAAAAAAAAHSAAGTEQSVLFQLFLLDTNFVMSLFQCGLQAWILMKG